MIFIVGFLPPPPGTPESPSDGGLETLEILALVALILGGVMLVAWLLKPIVAKRLHRQEALAKTDVGDSSRTANPRWNENWSRTTVSAVEGGVETSGRDEPPPDSEVVPNLIEPVEQSRGADIPASAPSLVEAPFDATVEDDNLASAPDLVVDSDAGDIIAITTTVRTLLERANAGRIRDGFALYSESALQRFRDDTGLTAEEFDRAFEAVPPPPPDQQAELAAITDIERLGDGRIRALISYGNGGSFPAPEYFTFVHTTGDEWLIDEIAPAES